MYLTGSAGEEDWEGQGTATTRAANLCGQVQDKAGKYKPLGLNSLITGGWGGSEGEEAWQGQGTDPTRESHRTCHGDEKSGINKL